jgi:lactate dehydrogenase-like 2-hydroxyacid dehydrogenase
MIKRVLVFARLFPESFSELSEHFEVVFPEKTPFTKEEIIQLLPDFDAFIPIGFKVDKEILDVAAKRVKIISNYGDGYNNIDVAYATRCGIVVTNTPDPVIEPTAEQALALILAAARRISESDQKIRSSKGLKWYNIENFGQSLYGKTLGIVGMGRIGQALARRAMACGMNILYHNRQPIAPGLEATYQTRRLELDELMKTSDVISINTPLTDETYHLINRARLQLTKETAIVVNTARGAVIEESALVEALQKKWIAAAGLDVFEFEPQISPELLLMDNVVLSPHTGAATISACNEIGLFASRNIIRFFQGRTDIARVN